MLANTNTLGMRLVLMLTNIENGQVTLQQEQIIKLVAKMIVLPITS